MSKILWKSLLISPAVLGAVLAVSTSAIAASTGSNTEATQASVAQSQAEVSATELAQPIAPANVEVPQQIAQTSVETIQKSEPSAVTPATNAPALTQIRRYSNEGKAKESDAIGQVTSVSQLSDVQPTDWAFQALQSLVERYGVIAGYPDGTYRGNRAMTRYEFAAGLNAALDRVNELIAAGTADLVTKEDLATLQRLQEEFAAELATLRGRVDALEARTAELEANQFSTTTKLVGEAIFQVTVPFNNPTQITGTGVTPFTTTPGLPTTRSNAGLNNQTVFQDRVRLSLQTSFTGRDLLVSRISAGNATAFAIPGGGAELTQPIQFAPGIPTNSAGIDWVAYYLPLGDKAQLYLPAVGGLHYDYAPTINPALDGFDSGTAAISIFSQRNPIYDIGGGSGIGFNYNFNNAIGVSFGYLAANGSNFAANNPAQGNGLFNGSYSALGQLTITPNQAIQIGLTYVNGYRQAGEAIFDAGSNAAQVGTLPGNFGGFLGVPTAINAYGVSGSLRLSPQFVINGWGSYINARALRGSALLGGNAADGDIWTYAVGVAFPDLGRRGNLGGITVGVQPYLAGLKIPGGAQVGGFKNSNPIHVEGFYKYQVSDNISITPGVIWIIAPGQDDRNDNVVIGTLRTTFTF